MSNKDNEKDYSDLTNALQFVFNQFIKDIYVSIPGIIQSYNSTTKRCRVAPAINIRKTDGSSFSPSEIVNVPVLWPGGGGFVLLATPQKGDAVEIKFSQRGITKFKEGFVQADPGNGMFDKEDAHVIPGYGALEVTPATGDGISLQNEAGSNYIFVEDGKVEIKATTEVNVIAPKVNVTSPIVEIIAATSVAITSIITTITGNLTVTGILTVATFSITNLSANALTVVTSLIAAGKQLIGHGHAQGPDSPSGDTQQNTGPNL